MFIRFKGKKKLKEMNLFENITYNFIYIVREEVFRNVSSFARSPLIFFLMVKFKYFLDGSLKKSMYFNTL